VEIVHDVIAWIKQKRREKRELAALKELAKIFPGGEARGQIESHSDHPRWVKRVLRVGLILVVIGVVGEWRYGAKLEDSHNAIHEYDVAKLTAAEKEAGNAATSARTAHEEADAVKLEADAIQKRLDKASTQLRGIEKDVRAQGPRWRLLEAGKTKFIEVLKPFAGQRFSVVRCGLKSEPESFMLEQDLIHFLGKDGAGWELVTYTTWTRCGSVPGGNQVIVSMSGGKTVKDSAQALSDVLNKLKISTATPFRIAPQIPPPEILGADSPYALVTNDPRTVFILVGPNPMRMLSDLGKVGISHK